MRNIYWIFLIITLTSCLSNSSKTDSNKVLQVQELSKFFESNIITPVVVVNNIENNLTEIKILNHTIKWLDKEDETRIKIDNDLFTLKDKVTINNVMNSVDSVDNMVNNWDFIKLYNLEDRELIAISMCYSPCTGTGCNVEYYLIYDLKNKTKSFFGSYRVRNIFYSGGLNLYKFNNDSKNTDFVSVDYGETVIDSKLIEEIYSFNLYYLNEKGLFVPKKNKKGKMINAKYTISAGDTVVAKKLEQNWTETIK